ncbi:hypothetical protein TPSD3_02375 [Thioflexithrix psekupsensis]|uniref:ABC transporter substrate-binding protein n=2 Tax=Thioflexithrix psekupsensis TaxID=1570016 RepID=A0A251XAN3_9GAMM|nr:hypothetical protein TPSD3_02375 [Thioflexithrix psekupsensis]
MSRVPLFLKIIVGLFFSAVLAFCVQAKQECFSTSPNLKNGQKWRVAYVQGGPYIHYRTNLISLLEALRDLNWVEPFQLPEAKSNDDTEELWQWLSKNIRSNYIEFVADAYWCGQWPKQEEEKAAFKEKVLSRLRTSSDIDLVLAFGTLGGQIMAEKVHRIPTLVMSIADAVAAGVVESASDSGFDYIHARVDSTRFERQLELFHRIVQFDVLGIVYEDSDIGRSYAGVTRIQNMAKKLGFHLTECKAPSDKTVVVQKTIECYQYLAPIVDAVYLTYDVNIKEAHLPDIIAPLLAYKRPSFSQSGPREVKYGALMGMTDVSYKEVGFFHASTMAKIFNGAKPRQLNQEFPNPYRLAINVETERQIGFQFPDSILMMVDEVYTDIRTVP